MATTAPSPDLTPLYAAAAQEWGVDPLLLRAIAQQESGENVNTPNSKAGAMGLMQFMPATAADVGVQDPRDPAQSIYGAAKLLGAPGGLLDRYGSPELALAAYNGGPQRVNDYIAGRAPLPAETAAYIPSVTRRYQALAAQQPSASSAPSVDATATANLDARMAQLRAGGSQGAPSAADQPGTPANDANPFAAMSPSQFFAATAGGAQPDANGATSPTTDQSPTANPFANMAPADFFAATAGLPPSTPSAQPSQAGTPAPEMTTGTIVQPGDPRLTAPGGTAYRNADGTFTLLQTAPAPAAQAVATSSGPQAQSGYRIPGTDISLPSVTNLAEGAGHAVLQGSRALYSAIDAGNRAVPLPGQDLGGLIDPQAALANLDAENAQYQRSGMGNTLTGQAGDLAGQTILTLPALGGLGALASGVGRGIAAGADAISPAVGAGARALGSFVSGTARTGNGLTDAVLRPASLAANGAAQGATVNLLTGSQDAGVQNNLLTGAALGAGAGIAGPAAAGVMGRLYDGAASLVRPFTTAGQATIADRALVRMGQDGPLAIDATPLVPGSAPTLAQATANPGIASVERAVASRYPNLFNERSAANNDARSDLVNRLTGSTADIDAAAAARDATAVPAITRPLTGATAPADAQPVVDTIDQILASPAGQRDAVTAALGNIRSKLVTPIPFGDRVGSALDAVNQAITSNTGGIDPGLWAARDALVAACNGGAQQASTMARLQATTSTDPAAQAVIDEARSTISTAQQVQSDPAQLYGIRKAIGDSLSPLSARAGSDAQLASRELQQVKAELDNAIEGAAPGFKQGLADYADSSRPIDAMRYLQSKNFTSADGTVTLAKVRGVLDDIRKQQALPGPRDAKSVPAATVDSLQALYADLLRQNNSRLGMQAGSNTYQNLATDSALAGVGAPLALAGRALNRVPVVGNLLTGGIASAYRAQNDAIQGALINRLLHPDLAAPAFAGAGRQAPVQGANLLTTAPLTIAGDRLTDFSR